MMNTLKKTAAITAKVIAKIWTKMLTCIAVFMAALAILEAFTGLLSTGWVPLAVITAMLIIFRVSRRACHQAFDLWMVVIIATIGNGIFKGNLEMSTVVFEAIVAAFLAVGWLTRRA